MGTYHECLVTCKLEISIKFGVCTVRCVDSLFAFQMSKISVNKGRIRWWMLSRVD